MNKIRNLLIIGIFLFIAPFSRASSIFYVDVCGPNDPGTGTFSDPFQRIQDAIDFANSGDVIEIRPGIYTADSNNYNLDPKGKSISIRSTDPNDPEIVVNTIIDPNGAGRGFHIHNGEDANCVISGLTIRNAYVSAGNNGAGIYCYDCSPTIRNCVIRDGLAEDGSGGGICFDYGSVNVINCTITGNTAGHYGYGGGISCRFSSPTIIGCTINGNKATITGGGIDSGASEPNIFNCIIFDNSASAGGGINCYYPGVTKVTNCTIVANSAEYFGGAVHSWSDSNACIENSILWANSAADGAELGLQQAGMATIAYCEVQDGSQGAYDPCEQLAWGSGNINIDPCFVLFDHNGDPNLWDFHLISSDGRWNSTFYKVDLNKDGIINLIDFARLARIWMQEGILAEDLNNNGAVDTNDLGLLAQYYLVNRLEGGWISDEMTSPCVDAGDPNSDWSGEPWPNGKRINMGAFGGTEQASMNGNLADFDINGAVNFTDFAGFAGKWMTQGSFIEDLSSNGVVDYADISMFAENWLWQQE